MFLHDRLIRYSPPMLSCVLEHEHVCSDVRNGCGLGGHVLPEPDEPARGDPNGEDGHL